MTNTNEEKKGELCFVDIDTAVRILEEQVYRQRNNLKAQQGKTIYRFEELSTIDKRHLAGDIDIDIRSQSEEHGLWIQGVKEQYRFRFFDAENWPSGHITAARIEFGTKFRKDSSDDSLLRYFTPDNSVVYTAEFSGYNGHEGRLGLPSSPSPWNISPLDCNQREYGLNSEHRLQLMYFHQYARNRVEEALGALGLEELIGKSPKRRSFSLFRRK